MKNMFQRILAPTDFSPYSNEGLKLAADLAEQFRASLTAFHVVTAHELKEQKARPSPEGYLDNIIRETEQHTMAYCVKLLDPDNRDFRLDVAVARGDPLVEIIRAARNRQSDVIVMATHGRTALNHLLMGSVAEKVVRMAECPVLTVKPPEHKFEMV